MTIIDLTTHPEPYVSVGALARYWCVAPSTIYRHIDKGALYAERIGPYRLIRIPTSEARRYGHPDPVADVARVAPHRIAPSARTRDPPRWPVYG